MNDELKTFLSLKYGSLIIMHDKWMADEINPTSREREILADWMGTTVGALETQWRMHRRTEYGVYW